VYDRAPVLVVQTERFHPGGVDADFRVLLDKLDTMTGPRDFLGAPAAPDLT
jgi:deoxyguanosine kinase